MRFPGSEQPEPKSDDKEEDDEALLQDDFDFGEELVSPFPTSKPDVKESTLGRFPTGSGNMGNLSDDTRSADVTADE